MKLSSAAVAILSITLGLILVPGFSWAADDGATLYKTKCAACHGVDGAGKPAANIPSLVSDEARDASDADLADQIANGGRARKAAHAFEAKGLSPDHVKMILAYIRQLQRK